MDSKQRTKTLRKLLDLASNPEVAALGRQVFCADPAIGAQDHLKPQQPIMDAEEKHRKAEQLTAIFNLLAQAVAFGSWGYTVVAPEPNMYLGSLLFLIAISLALTAWWIGLEWKVKTKAISVAVAVFIFLIADYKFVANYYGRKHREQQDEVYDKLNLSVIPSPDKSLLKAFYSITIGSAKSTIGEHSSTCVINRIVSYEGGSLQVPNGVRFQSDKTPLRGGDAYTGRCEIRWAGEPQCMDVTYVFNYVLQDYPDEQKQKRFRFVAAVPWGSVWVPMSSGYSGTYCDAFTGRKLEAMPHAPGQTP